MTSKIVVNNIQTDAGISSVTLLSHIAGHDSTQNISGINSVTANAFYGDGSNLTGAGPTLSSGSNDRVITATGANALLGEANLTFSGSVLNINGTSDDTPLMIDTASNNGAHLRFRKDGSNQHFVGSGGGFGLGDKEDLSLRGYDNILFATGNSSTEKLRISSEGYLTQPNRPAFSTSAQTSGFSANSLNYLTPSAIVNNGNHYNASNGRFTAPIAGTYFFFFSYVGDNGVAAPVMYFYKNGASSGPGSSCYYTAYQGAYHGILLTLAVNDYVNASARDWNGATPDPWNTYWGGWLLY